jgi:hypothetical protein
VPAKGLDVMEFPSKSVTATFTVITLPTIFSCNSLIAPIIVFSDVYKAEISVYRRSSKETPPGAIDVVSHSSYCQIGINY